MNFSAPTGPPPETPSTSVIDGPAVLQARFLPGAVPKPEAIAYTFVYKDTDAFPAELEEWFSYADDERDTILSGRHVFDKAWTKFREGKDIQQNYVDVEESVQKRFVQQQTAGLESSSLEARGQSLEILTYLLLGVWAETAGKPVNVEDEEEAKSDIADDVTDIDDDEMSQYKKLSLQILWMKKNARLLCSTMGTQLLYDVLRAACNREWDDDADPVQSVSEDRRKAKELGMRELRNALTAMYVLVEVGRLDIAAADDTSIRDELAQLEPPLLPFQVKTLAKLRWDESTALPLSNILLLLWKSILLLIGDTEDLKEAKTYADRLYGLAASMNKKDLITASPLDYHLFRQELISKYPAYNPPPPLFPLEFDNNSILPPLPNHPSRQTTNNLFSGVGPANISGSAQSILHQPVHIATPMPSPPPSPAAGGKGGKRQNYQTNNNFPFMYPPLDSSSNGAGGKGGAGLQEALVGRKWEGSDIPASILEAGEIFAKRMRMTREMKQLWEEREKWMKFERGWGGLTDDEDEENEKERAEQLKKKSGDSESDAESRRRLDAVESFYRDAFPHLQSFIIVLLKVILANVNAVADKNGGALNLSQEGNTNGFFKGRQPDQNDPGGSPPPEPLYSNEEYDLVRQREITAKAVTGMLLMMLKWMKVSHVLKYEYMTQLLLDSNYLPLVLKLIACTEMDKVVATKMDKPDLNFFNVCLVNSTNTTEEDDVDDSASIEIESDDEAAPPPIIKLQREEQRSPPVETMTRIHQFDEMGNPLPTADGISPEPSDHYSWRNFFSNINFLRIMQKICKNKAHRNLMMVQYKSGQFLKRSLKVPQRELHLYTLKLFKSQVPYCGRKWRQSNMRVITAVYLQCRPELRDDWLAGTDIDVDVEESLPLEQAMRALTHWYNLKRYPEQMGADASVLQEEQDFFIRELEKMDFADDIDENEGWDGPLAVDGW